MAKAVLAILLVDEERGNLQEGNGEALLYPVRDVEASFQEQVLTGADFIEAMTPNAIVDALLEMDDEDLIDALHQIVPEMAPEAWLMAIRRERQLRIDIPERRA